MSSNEVKVGALTLGGIGLLAVASPMAQEVVKMTPMAAASMVGIIGLINGLGRIFWSTISDYLGRSTVYVVFFLIQIFAFYALAETSSVFVFQLIVFVIISCYGGGFSCMPAFLSDLFGTKELSAIQLPCTSSLPASLSASSSPVF